MLRRLTDFLRNFSLFDSHHFVDLAFNKLSKHPSLPTKFTRESFTDYVITLAKQNSYIFEILFDNDVDSDFDWRQHEISDQFNIDYGSLIQQKFSATEFWYKSLIYRLMYSI